MCFRLNRTEGAQACLLPLVSEGRGLAWEVSMLPGPEWVGQTSSAPPLLFQSQKTPPTCLSCSLLAFLLRPRDQPNPEGTSEGIGHGPGLRAGQTSPADWAGETLGMLPPDPSPEGPSSCGNPSPLSATPQGCRSCLTSASPPLSVPPPCPSSSLGDSSHQCLAGTLVVGGHELRVLPHCHLDSAPRSYF